MSYAQSAYAITGCRIVMLTLLALLLSAHKAKSQNDEAVIRQLVADHNTGKAMLRYTDDRVFVSGAYPRPSYSANDQVFRQVSDSLRKVRQDQQQQQEIKRLQVAASGDMAYEVGEGRLRFTANNQRADVSNAYVRIWRKVDGQWLVDVFFARPNREP